MAIKVRFDKDGWYHPAYGRLGRGDKHAGTVYTLPDMFGEKETVEVELRDPRTKLPTGEVRKRERYKFLPRTAEVFDDVDLELLKQDAEESGEEPPRVVRPKPDQTELDRVAGKGKVAKTQSAQERTTGQKTTARRKS
jgi:hypothetical protein